ncbi:MAG: hypothetical protein P1Q69_17305, partial [Candidatus Thorarchaeota archaeon]|nr:hypothetical protein [Candidatus Thorarchaeota archaeon]
MTHRRIMLLGVLVMFFMITTISTIPGTNNHMRMSGEINFTDSPLKSDVAYAGKIVVDYSHGQYNPSISDTIDRPLFDNLTAMGHEVILADGGINDTILSDAQGLLVGALYGTNNNFESSEIASIANWFNSGKKFMWIGYDSDFGGQQYIIDNMTSILTEVGSHMYGEPAEVDDDDGLLVASYRAVANRTSTNPFVSATIKDVEGVLMHGGTCIYGSTAAQPTVDVVELETSEVDNVYPLLYYGEGGYIVDYDLIPPLAHSEGQTGGFTAAALEIDAGDNTSSILVASGASPYGDYRPMCTDEYYDVELT